MDTTNQCVSLFFQYNTTVAIEMVMGNLGGERGREEEELIKRSTINPVNSCPEQLHR